jgi:hypothetical protein
MNQDDSIEKPNDDKTDPEEKEAGNCTKCSCKSFVYNNDQPATCANCGHLDIQHF